MKIRFAVCCAVFTAGMALAQSDRGTITGDVLDQSGASVPGALVVALNSENGTSYQTIATPTGNFTIPSLPAGIYNVSVAATGFKKFASPGVQVQVAQTVRLDAKLEVGSANESVTVQAEVALLRTENAEQSMNVNGNRINNLPLNFGGGGGSTGAVRDPLAFVVLAPGVAGNNSGAAINGFAGSTYRILFEGQDATSGNANARANEVQGSVDMIGEFTLQTSNFAAEFGQVTGALINFTARSGTNQFHGGAYEYFANEALNAQRPFSYVNPTSRKHDFGFTFGGPVRIPKVYNGKDRTFFFFNFERYYNKGSSNGTFGAVPTDAERGGDFSGILTGRTLTDSQGNKIPEYAIFDPASDQLVNGNIIRTQFPGNIIPKNRLDPVALKVQALIPEPTNPGLVNNWNYNSLSSKKQIIPALKLDQNFSIREHASFYWSEEKTHQFSSADGLPAPITAIRDQQIYSHTLRLNADHTLTPTFLAHTGIGYIRYLNPDSSPASVLGDYNAVTGIGFTGGATAGFPRLNGLNSAQGGVVNITNGFGPTNANKYYNDKFTAVASATWVRGNHAFKAGGELKIDIWTDRNSRGATGVLNFSSNSTALPYLNTSSVGGGSIGFPYASFLLGAVDNATVNPVQDPQLRKPGYGIYVQDSWKITHRLTLDYGLRWDYEGEGHEIHNRFSEFGPSTPNPSAGGLPGAVIYEGNGTGRCNCQFANSYPYAIGPRLGAAYQINPKTVLRGGVGVSYAQLAGYNYITNNPILGVGFNQLTFSNPQFGAVPVTLSGGLRYNSADLFTASLDPGIRPSAGQTNSPNFYIDPNGGRPGRVLQFNVSIQRELMRDLVLETAYVGNRGAWLTATNLINLNAIAPAKLASLGLDPTNAADRTLLSSQIGSATAQARGFKAPYAGFPTNATVAQSLRPYPQFGGISVNWAPLGDSWYDSLQTKVTKRYSHGLDLTGSFTWSKALSTTGPINNVFNRPNQKALASFDQPFIFIAGFNYQVPKATQNKLVRQLTGGWTVGGILHYASGSLIQTPGSQNNLNASLFQSTLMNRVPGQPLYLKDLNCHCIDPNKDFVLNPAAWSDPAPGTWGTSAPYYGDFRFAHRPDEQMSIGRRFQIREGMHLQVRAEFFNVLNRIYLANPVASNPLQTPTRNNALVPTGGYGYINATAIQTQPRNGQLVARFEF